MPHIVALFGSSALSVASAIPHDAQDAAGRVEQVEGETLVLNGGRRFALPSCFDARGLAIGMEVHVLYVADSGRD